MINGTAGTVWCWGYGTYGELGDGTQHHVDVDAVRADRPHGVQQVAVGGYHACAIAGGD